MAHRSSFRWFWFWIPVILALMWLGRCAHAADAQLVATPRAKPLAVSATNRPFLAADRTVLPVALKAAGYGETEYLVSGLANVYDWTTNTRATELQLRASANAYTTRILVRRPTDLGKFSGLVVVELLDAGDLYDRAPLWGLSAQQFMRRGDAWVGVTVRPAAAAALRRFDQVRYGALSFNFSQPGACQPVPDLRAFPPDTELGLAWDLIAQVGALLRSSSKENPLLALNPQFMIAAGHGEAGAYVTNYANALHAVLRRGDGAPIYDGYLDAGGAQLAVPINQCAEPLPETDPRRRALPRDVPFVTVMTEADFNLAPSLRRADSDAPEDVFRLYEIAGAPRAATWPAGVPVASDLQIAGFGPALDEQCTATNTLPVDMVFNSIWQQYAELLTEGRPMQSLPRIETLSDGEPRRDEAGNSSGGWRLPLLDEPLAVYASEGANGACAAGGAVTPFDAAKLKTLYRDRAEYLRRFNAAVDRAVEQRRLVPEDGETLKNQQRQGPSPF